MYKPEAREKERVTAWKDKRIIGLESENQYLKSELNNANNNIITLKALLSEAREASKQRLRKKDKRIETLTLSRNNWRKKYESHRVELRELKDLRAEVHHLRSALQGYEHFDEKRTCKYCLRAVIKDKELCPVHHHQQAMQVLRIVAGKEAA